MPFFLDRENSVCPLSWSALVASTSAAPMFTLRCRLEGLFGGDRDGGSNMKRNEGERERDERKLCLPRLCANPHSNVNKKFGLQRGHVGARVAQPPRGLQAACLPRGCGLSRIGDNAPLPPRHPCNRGRGEGIVLFVWQCQKVPDCVFTSPRVQSQMVRKWVLHVSSVCVRMCD